MIQAALLECAWYCTRYLLTLAQLDKYHIEWQATLLLSAVKSGEPAMLTLLDVDKEAVSYPLDGGSVVQNVVSDANTEMARILKDRWDETFKCLEDEDHLFYTHFQFSATMKILASSNEQDRDTICARQFDGRGLGMAYRDVVVRALQTNDFILLENIAAKRPGILYAAFHKEPQRKSTIEALRYAAEHNYGASILAVRDYAGLDERFDGLSVIHWALRANCISTVEKLLEAGADPLQYAGGETPLAHFLEQIEDGYNPSIRCAALLARRLNVVWIEVMDHWTSGGPDDSLWRVLYDGDYFRREFEASKGLDTVMDSMHTSGACL